MQGGPDAGLRIRGAFRRLRARPATRVIAIDMPNENSLDSKDWQSYRTSVDRIENATGYDFLSNVSSVIQTAVEARVDNL